VTGGPGGPRGPGKIVLPGPGAGPDPVPGNSGALKTCGAPPQPTGTQPMAAAAQRTQPMAATAAAAREDTMFCFKVF
jgi:hypothetical protein